MSIEEKAYQSTPHNELIAQIMSEMTPKTEREHAAKREIQRLREAIEQTEKQEPVAVVALDTSRPFVAASYGGQVTPWTQAPEAKTVMMFKDLPLNTPLYTAPPQREWVGLTDAERELAAWSSSNFLKMAESIEARLKEKNT